MVSRETLVEAVKALNSSGLSKKQVSPDLKRYEELKEKFLEAAETVPISREEELPTIVGQTYRDWETDRKSTRLNSSHSAKSRMPSSA